MNDRLRLGHAEDEPARAVQPVAEVDVGGLGVGAGADVAGVVAVDGVPGEAADQHAATVEPAGGPGGDGPGEHATAQQGAEGGAGAAGVDLPAGGVTQERAEQARAGDGGRAEAVERAGGQGDPGVDDGDPPDLLRQPGDHPVDDGRPAQLLGEPQLGGRAVAPDDARAPPLDRDDGQPVPVRPQRPHTPRA